MQVSPTGSCSALKTSHTLHCVFWGSSLSRRQPHCKPGTSSVSCQSGSSPLVAKSGALKTAASAVSTAPTRTNDADTAPRRLKVLIAGAGIGGLVLAAGLLKRGIDVQLFERDLTAIRGEGKYRGPIQVQSNALAALEAIDPELARAVMAEGCITGDRINGLCDGLTGDWYVKFDTFHPAVDKGLPVTRVISRVTLQNILVQMCMEMAGETVVQGNSHVVDYEETVDAVTGQKKVIAVLEDGRKYEGDILVGADGIWSKIRRQIVGHTEAHYSEYTCYTGIADWTPPDIETVGYRVYLGNGQYFVSSDVGGGKMQWYGFHKEPAGGGDAPGTRKERLHDIFGHWCDLVTDLIKTTPEDDILRRDIYDRPPIFKWSDGRVVLIGDSAHAMQPNLGQGGCMAIEDGFTLARDLVGAAEKMEAGQHVDLEQLLRDYMMKRIVRVSAIHGMAGMAANMASTYKAYLGEGLGPLSWIKKFKIPHPGRVSGQVVMKLAMPAVLEWVLGGNAHELNNSNRPPVCLLEDKPRGFDEKDFGVLMADDEALLKAARAHWLLVPQTPDSIDSQAATACSSALPCIQIDESEAFTIGRDGSCSLVLDQPTVAKEHATVHHRDGVYYIRDLGSGHGTWINGRRIPAYQDVKLKPSDAIVFGTDKEALNFKLKLRHVSLTDGSIVRVDKTPVCLSRTDKEWTFSLSKKVGHQSGTKAAVV